MKKKISLIILALVVLAGVAVLIVAPWNTDFRQSKIDVLLMSDWLQEQLPNKTITEEEIEKKWHAEYSYTFVQRIGDPDVADVHLEVILKGDGVEITVSASGDVRPEQDDKTGWVFWHGPIDGTAIINGMEHTVKVGIWKDHTKDDIYATIQLGGILAIGDEDSWEKINDYIEEKTNTD